MASSSMALNETDPAARSTEERALPESSVEKIVKEIWPGIEHTGAYKHVLEAAPRMIADADRKANSRAYAKELLSLLEREYGYLPVKLVKRVLGATDSEIQGWYTTALRARSPEDIFGDGWPMSGGLISSAAVWKIVDAAAPRTDLLANIQLLAHALESVFGSLPDDCRKRLDAADKADILRWTIRLHGATSLDQIFDDSADT